MRKNAPVMVIEDNPTDVFLVREALRAQGIAGDVLVFEDGEAAPDSFWARSMAATGLLDGKALCGCE